MRKIWLQSRRELRDLPLMLGKFLGGIAAVFGVTIMVVILTRQPQVRFKETLGLLLLAGAGLAVFSLSKKRLARRTAVYEEKTLPSGWSRLSLLSWSLFLFVSGIFLITVYLLTR
jgi:hypothetical protein